MREITNEEERFYLYPDEFRVRIDTPVAISSYNNGDGIVHEVRNSLGTVFIIQPGWRVLTITPKSSEDKTNA